MIFRNVWNISYADNMNTSQENGIRGVLLKLIFASHRMKHRFEILSQIFSLSIRRIGKRSYHLFTTSILAMLM